MKKTGALLLLLGLFAAMVAVAAIGRSSSAQPNVMLIVLDTLRADHLGSYGYPRATSPILDGFASENVKFNYAVTAAPWTPPSLATMFSGVYPSRHGMMPPDGRDLARQSATRLDDKVLTLAEIFRQHGYVTAGITPNPWMQAEFGFDQGFDRYHYRDRGRAEEINQTAFAVIAEMSKIPKPFFLFLHYLDPHDPYDPPAPYRAMFSGTPPGPAYSAEIEDLINRYDGEIRYLDDQLAELFAFLKDRGLYDDLRVAVVGDHGEQFMEHGHLTHGFEVHNEELHVPLFLKTGQPHRAPDFTVSTVDVFPSLLEMAAIEVPTHAQGLSLLDDDKSGGRAGVLSEITRKYNQKAFTDLEGRKLIVDYPLDSGAIQDDALAGNSLGVFDRRTDYAERNPSRDPAVAEPMKRALAALYGATIKDRVESTAAPLSDKTREQLRALGYLN